MSKINAPIVFIGIGTIQSYVVPASGRYVIEAAGAQGGAGGGPGGKGARVKGTFNLTEGDVLQMVVGHQGTSGSTPHQPAGGGGGGSFVWKGATARLMPAGGGGGGGGSFVWKGAMPRVLPAKPMLAAGGGGGGNGGDGVVTIDAARGAGSGGRNGHGGAADLGDFHYSGGGGTGWLSAGANGSAPTFCQGGEHWAGGLGADYCGNAGGNGGFGGGGGGAFIGSGSGGGGGYSGGGGGTQVGPGGGGGSSYNAGENQTNTPGVQTGDGYVSIVAVPAPVAASTADKFPIYAVPGRITVFGMGLQRTVGSAVCRVPAAADFSTFPWNLDL